VGARFSDRREAGRTLARELDHHRESDAVVLGLARGGVPVAYEIAISLRLDLDVIVVRKLGLPGQPELAMGAIAGGALVRNEQVIDAGDIDEHTLRLATEHAADELAEREREYRRGHPRSEAAGRTAILIDDGLATGSSMLAAVHSLRRQRAAVVIVAVPVAPRESCRALARVADEVVCGFMPNPFLSVGTWYEDFAQTSDEEVRRLLDLARGAAQSSRNSPSL
jgi:predicted phosphoribosyltransferase